MNVTQEPNLGISRFGLVQRLCFQFYIQEFCEDGITLCLFARAANCGAWVEDKTSGCDYENKTLEYDCPGVARILTSSIMDINAMSFVCLARE